MMMMMMIFSMQSLEILRHVWPPFYYHKENYPQDVDAIEVADNAEKGPLLNSNMS